MRILIAGLGSAGQRHVRNLRALLGSDVDLLAYRMRGLSRVLVGDGTVQDGPVEARYGIRAFTRLEDALAERPDAVFVTNPTAGHVSVALAAARAGCHLFIEKPVSHTLDGLDALATEVRTRGLVCMVGYQLRFHPVFQCVADLLNREVAGPVLSARVDFGEYLPAWHPWEDYRGMFQSHREQGGGVLLEQSHDLDYVRALFGTPRTVMAVGGRSGQLDIDAEDTADLLLACGEADAPIPVHVHQDMLRQPQTRTCVVTGRDGRIEADFVRGTVTLVHSGGRMESMPVPAIERNALFLAELRRFLDALSGSAEPPVGLADATMTLRVVRAAFASMASGEPALVC